MRFLIDAQLPPGLVYWLEEKDLTAEHVDYCGLTSANDSDIWKYALQTDSIIITKDEDFAERTIRTADGPVIIWLRIGNATNRALKEWLEPRWLATYDLVAKGNRLVEVR